MQEELRKLPSVETILQRPEIKQSVGESARRVVLESIRQVMLEARQEITSGRPCPSLDSLVDRTLFHLQDRERLILRKVINATGVIVHTNLGRAPLSDDARAAINLVAEGYSNLEYDLEAGVRGSRHVHTEQLLSKLTGADSAMLVNNNAGALLLVLTALARGQEVIISRGQLVEIGGGFRIPEVMSQSGVRLIEVGTTNRTNLSDFENAIGDETALLMHVHHSNFRLLGFTHETTLRELSDLASHHGLLVVEDLGSGCLLDTSVHGLAHEPTVQEAVQQGADLICFSGDKLLGGPQAGIIVGRADLVSALKRHPLARALRVDKTTMAGMQATLLHYLREEATEKIPVWQMISLGLDEIDDRANAWVEQLRSTGVRVEAIPGLSTVGGGSLPGETLPTKLVAMHVTSPDELAARLRSSEPPVIGRIESGELLLDPRTVLTSEEQDLLSAVKQAVQS
jgi:L-seryl-tRNA(Ser) seleniumtransferase